MDSEAFAKAWKTRFYRCDIIVPGFGKADLIVGDSEVLWVFKFETSDWQKGLIQAYRHCAYADVVILVIPKDKLRTAKRHLRTFRKLKVGLWGFDGKRGIRMIYTPMPRRGGKA